MPYSQLRRVGVAKSCPTHKYTITLSKWRIHTMKILMLYSKIICGRVQSHIKPHPSLILYCNIIITYSIHIVSTNV